MKATCRTVGSQTYFIISELDLAYYDLIRNLAFSRVEDGFARVFPTDSQHLDHIYHNFARCAEELILQKAGIHPAPWEQALLARSILQRNVQNYDRCDPDAEIGRAHV